MHKLSKNYDYDAVYFSGRLPEDLCLLPPEGHDIPVLIRRNLLTKEECDNACSLLGLQGPTAKSDIDVLEKHRESSHLGEKVQDIVRKGGRNSFHYDLIPPLLDLYRGRMKEVKTEVESFFNVELGPSTGAHALGYGPGSLYGLHSDNCDPVFDADGNIERFTLIRSNRQISTLLYLSESVETIMGKNQFIGGNISFRFLRNENDQPLLVEPEQGMFIAFPSNPVFAHEVHEVFDGYRIAIVDWFSATLNPTIK